MTTTRRRLAAALAASAAVAVVPAAMPASADDGFTYVNTSGPLVDYNAGRDDPTDGARAHFIAFGTEETGTHAILIVTGLDPEAAGTTLGAHVHEGPCVPGNGAAAGPHYNIGGPADEEHEVWLDFTIRPGGVAVSRAAVPFTIPPGDAQSIVIHEMATQPGGAAGGRLACLPVEF